MAIDSNTQLTFGTIGIREDLSDLIYNISPTDTPFMGAIGKSKAKTTYHEWLTDSLIAAATNAQLEGDTFAAAANVETTRVGNYTQISSKSVEVSNTMLSVDTAGRTEELVYRLSKMTKELKRDMEFALLSNQAPVGSGANSTTARVLRPLNSWYSTNVSKAGNGANGSATTARTDGTQRALTEVMFKAVQALIWNAGGNPSTAISGVFNRGVLSGLAGPTGTYRVNEADSRRLITTVDVYEGDFGSLTLIPDHFSRDRDLHIITPDMLAVATLRPMTTTDMAKTGDNERALITVEYTLEVRNEAANGIVADLTTS